MSVAGKFVENKNKPWHTTYTHQKRVDVTARLAKTLPVERLVNKKGRHFTTSASKDVLTREMEKRDTAPPMAMQSVTVTPSEKPIDMPKGQRFMAKNASPK